MKSKESLGHKYQNAGAIISSKNRVINIFVVTYSINKIYFPQS